MASRRQAREWAMQILFGLEANPQEVADAISDLLNQQDDADESTKAFASDLVLGVLENSEKIHEILGEAATNWDVDRMSRVDRCVMEIAIFELLCRNDIPPAVSLNEAIEIVKNYSSLESSRFVNGILDNVMHSARLSEWSPGAGKEGSD